MCTLSALSAVVSVAALATCYYLLLSAVCVTVSSALAYDDGLGTTASHLTSVNVLHYAWHRTTYSVPQDLAQQTTLLGTTLFAPSAAVLRHELSTDNAVALSEHRSSTIEASGTIRQGARGKGRGARTPLLRKNSRRSPPHSIISVPSTQSPNLI